MSKMTADQMIKSMENMTNADRIEFLHYLSKKHFNTGKPTKDMYHTVKNHIQDYIDRDLTNEESTVMKLAYEEGYNIGVWIGMEKL